MTTRIVELRSGILKKNDELARVLRERFEAAGLLTLNLVSSPGTGKTAFLQRTLAELRERGQHPAALVGDLETDNDARRLAESGAPVRQINTHGICHLDAEMIERHLEGLDLASFHQLFIENVGNLVCPSSYDLGERIRVALLSVTEGEDKPLKYPTLFNSADVAVITKLDLAEACEFDREEAIHNIREIRPGIRIFEVSAKTGEGIEEWVDFLIAGGEASRRVAAAAAAVNAVAASKWSREEQRQGESRSPLLDFEATSEPEAVEAEPAEPESVEPTLAETIAAKGKNAVFTFRTQREAKEYLVFLICEEARRTGQSLNEVEHKMLYESEKGWVPEGMDDARQNFQRYHDQREYEEKVVGVIRSAWLRARAGKSDYESWQLAVRALRPGGNYLSDLIADAEGRKRNRSRAGLWRIYLALAAAVALALIWLNR